MAKPVPAHQVLTAVQLDTRACFMLETIDTTAVAAHQVQSYVARMQHVPGMPSKQLRYSCCNSMVVVMGESCMSVQCDYKCHAREEKARVW